MFAPPLSGDLGCFAWLGRRAAEPSQDDPSAGGGGASERGSSDPPPLTGGLEHTQGTAANRRLAYALPCAAPLCVVPRASVGCPNHTAGAQAAMGGPRRRFIPSTFARAPRLRLQPGGRRCPSRRRRRYQCVPQPRAAPALLPHGICGEGDVAPHGGDRAPQRRRAEGVLRGLSVRRHAAVHLLPPIQALDGASTAAG